MKVSVSVYDLAGSSANSFLSAFVGGIYHVGIEVSGVEWSYGYCDSGSGVFAVEPTKCTLGPFKERIVLGDTKMRADDIIRVLHKLRMEWVGPDYNVMNRNCVFFSKAFLRELNPKLHLPAYCRDLTEKAAGFSGSGGYSKLKNVDDVFGSKEKELMWREAERLMREIERDEVVDFSKLSEIIHSLLPMPPERSPNETRSICSQSLYHIRYQNYGEYMRRPAIRKLILNYR
jgi:hypothetical protein